VVLAIVAFALARTSRGLLLGEAANRQTVRAIRKAIESHPNVEKVVELLTMHLAPKEILINAHIEMRDDLLTDQIVGTIEEVEALIKQPNQRSKKFFWKWRATSATPTARRPRNKSDKLRRSSLRFGENKLHSLNRKSEIHKHTNTRCYCYCHTRSI
jgi:hypothetical protein